MTLGVALDGSPVSASRILVGGTGFQSVSGLPSAADGTGSQGGITYDDDDGSMTHRGWQIVKVDETDSTAAPTLFYGTSGPRTETTSPYRDGTGRRIDMTINDSNVFLSLRIIGGSTGSFPAETDTARMARLLADASLDGLVQDLGLITTTGLMLEPLYAQGMTPAEVLSDMASNYGQIFFTYWDQAAEAVGLFFDFADATTFTCPISISNVLSDITLDANEVVTGDVYPPEPGASLDITPEDVYSRVRFKYTGGVVWRTNATTSAAFFPEPLRYSSVQVENERIGKLTTATRFADHFLATHAQERAVVKFIVRLPSSRVGEIQAGMRINLTITPLTDVNDLWTRIERLNYIPVDGQPTLYDVSCECSTYGIHSGYGSGGGSTDPFPSVPPPVVAPTEFCCTQLVAGAGASDIRGTPAYTGTLSGLGNYAIVHIAALSVTGTLPTSDWVGMTLEYSWNGGGHFNAAVKSQVTIGHPGYPGGTQNICWNGGSLSACTGTEDGSPPSFPVLCGAKPTSGDDTFEIWGITGLSDSTATVTFCLTLGGVFDAATGLQVDNESAPEPVVTDPPSPGKPVGPEIVTMSGADGTTAYPFADNSLRVFVDNLDQTEAITAQDGSAGTFTLGFAPKAGEVVTVYYVAV